MRSSAALDGQVQAEQTGGEVERPEFGPLLQSLGFLLRMSQLASFEDFFAHRQELELGPGELSLLLFLAHNPGIRQGVVGQHLMIKRAHMTKKVRAMEEAGLILRSIPDDDRRSVELRLSPQGDALALRLTPAFEAYEALPKGPLSSTEEAELKRLLRKFAGLDSYLAEDGQ